MALVYEPKMAPSRENRVSERNGWSKELLVGMLGISGPKEKEELGIFTSPEKVYTRSCGGIGRLLAQRGHPIVESAPCGANQEISGNQESAPPFSHITQPQKTLQQAIKGVVQSLELCGLLLSLAMLQWPL